MQESLRQNELRPYEYIQNYAREIERMRENPAKSYRAQPDSGSSRGKLMSASPYRATIFINDEMEGSEEDYFDRDRILADVSPMEQFKRSRKSAIKDDSIVLRERGD